MGEEGYKTESEHLGEPLAKCSQHVNTELLGIWGTLITEGHVGNVCAGAGCVELGLSVMGL